MATVTVPRSQPTRSFSTEFFDVLPGALLAALMSGAVVYTLAISRWAPGLDILPVMALPGLVVGVVLARMRWLPGWLAHLLSSVLAVTWAVRLLGELMDPRLTTWRDQATDLLLRTINWSRVIGSGGRGEDILLFVAALCFLSWALCYGTAWMIFRRTWTWRPMVLNALIILINYTYVLPKPDVAFFVFLCSALLLLVYQHVRERQQQWDAQQIEYPDLLPLRFVWSAAMVCGVLILITATLPGSVTIERATQTWNVLSQPFRDARARWEDLFSTINAQPGSGSGAFTARGATLGGARQLGDRLVMYVRSTEYDYWRAVAFDRYGNGQWQNTVGEQARAALGAGTPEQARTPLDAGQGLPLFNVGGRIEVEQEFQLAEDRQDDLVLVGGTAQRLSIPARVEHNYRRVGAQLEPNYDETALIVSEEELRAGDTYTVTALVSKIDIQSLRNAGSDYPEWVRDRYLQLPDTITQRTRDRAAQIISDAGATNSYDQAIAIQEYLRTLRYDEAIPAPPSGVEPVDWFLFDQRSGYCDYFASSMVVMLRSQGIPARWVRGYAGGEFDVEQGVYVVRENLAHSWPEVYFPGIGWERFEPTPASYTSLPQRPLTSVFGEDTSELGPLASGPAPDPSRFEELDDGLDIVERGVQPLGELPNQNSGPWTALFGGLLAALALFGGGLYLYWNYELRGLNPVGRAYAGMLLLASWSGLSQQASRTPAEYADFLGDALPGHRRTIEQISAAYVAQRYRRGGGVDLPNQDDQQELRRALIRRIFTSITERLPQPRER